MLTLRFHYFCLLKNNDIQNLMFEPIFLLEDKDVNAFRIWDAKDVNSLRIRDAH